MERSFREDGEDFGFFGEEVGFWGFKVFLFVFRSFYRRVEGGVF